MPASRSGPPHPAGSGSQPLLAGDVPRCVKDLDTQSECCERVEANARPMAQVVDGTT